LNKLLIVSDMDGTLLDRSQKVSKENELAIKQFKTRGGLFTLATGRMEPAALPYIRQLEINIPVILYNGAKIYSPATGKVIYEKHLIVSRELWKRFNSAQTDQTAILVYRENDVFAPVRNETLENHERKDGVRCKQMKDEWIDEPITKILLIAPKEKLEQYEEMIVTSEIRCETVYSEENYLELLPEGATKGNALKQLVQMLQVEGLHTIAVGDNLNDVTMLQQANCGIAVENACEPLKCVADELTVHHEDHAIQAVIRKLMQTTNAI
jgi:Cof subfamily protein (haloacid dehalogenase superfamily)